MRHDYAPDTLVNQTLMSLVILHLSTYLGGCRQHIAAVCCPHSSFSDMNNSFLDGIHLLHGHLQQRMVHIQIFEW